MKKIFYLILITINALTVVSCRKGSFLDNKSTASLTKENTFADSANTMDYLAGLYIDNAFNFPLGSINADFSKMSDEAEGKFPAVGNFDKNVTQGVFGVVFYNQMNVMWANFYKDLHNENIYLANVDVSPLSPALKKRTKAEVRCIRALKYSFLMKWFGGVPIIGNKVYDADDKLDISRNTYEECVNYVLKELDAAANDLPTSYSGLDYGRVTKGACLALKSRVLLFAASPLYNGGAPTTDKALAPLLAYPAYDQQRWEKARLAARAVMDMGIYSLNIDNITKWGGNAQGRGYGFYNLFLHRVNSEFILPRPLPSGKQLENASFPKSRGGSGYFFFPTQELVDMFPTINGKPIATDVYNAVTNPTGFNPANPYANRDPRMAATIVYNGSLLYWNTTKSLSAVNTYAGAPNDGIVAITSNTSTCTGYYSRKMCDENASPMGGNNVDRSLPVIRYAEILLNYAEATNEMGNTAEAINTLKPLRQRAGINPGADDMYGLPANPTQNEARALIQNERAIELAFEEHRFWDIRRWKLGPSLDGKYVHGMQITKVGTNYTYKTVQVRTRYFKDVYYYFPLPFNEITLSQGKLLQNPGY